MQYAVALLALVASVSAQTKTGTPPGCSTDYAQQFQFEQVNVSVTATSSAAPTPSANYVCDQAPVISLKGGVLTDQNQRQAEIVANEQFQFDNPLQAGRKYTSGFSICQNGTIALGDSAIFYACKSGDIINLYDQSIGSQCYGVYFQVLPCGSVQLPSTAGTGATASAISNPSASAATTASSPSTATSVPASTAATTSSLAGPAIPAPYPSGNSTAAAGTASASGAKPATTTSATTSPLTAPASGASAMTVGLTFGLGAAALVAFAMF